MYKACIFDLDGSLINTLPALILTTNLTLKVFGLGPVGEEEIKQFVGDGYRKQIERALLFCGDHELACYEDALTVYMELFTVHCMHQLNAYEGIRELLDFLKEKNVKLAIFSNKPHDPTLQNTEGVFGKNYFDIVIGEGTGLPKKPSPEGVFEICRRLGFSPSDCLYLGDTNTDMDTGKAAGIDTAGLLWGFRKKEELLAGEPKYIFSHPREIMALFEQKDLAEAGSTL